MPDEPIGIFLCGGKGCPKGGDHQWDGPGIEWKNPCASCVGTGKRMTDAGEFTDEVCARCKGDGEGGGGGAATCSKCGLDAMSDAMWNGP
jgi:hypothetical protein